MKETLKRLRQSRCLPYLAVVLSFLAAWTGETGSLVWGGLCILLSLPLLAAPEYLLAPLLTAILLDNNCNILPGLTASRYFTLLFLAVEGLNVLLREKPGQWVRRFAYPALLILYVFFSAACIGHCVTPDTFSLGMSVALAVLMAALPSQRRARLWRLLPWSCVAVVSYMLFCLNFREVEAPGGRYWFMGATNVNVIGMSLAQTAILFFAAMAVRLVDRKGEWRSVVCFVGYVCSLYLLILTGSRSSLFGLVGGCAVLGVLSLLRGKKGRERRRQTAGLAVLCCLSAILCLTAPQIQQRVELWRYDMAHPAPQMEEAPPEAVPVQPEIPEAPPEAAPVQPEISETPPEAAPAQMEVPEAPLEAAPIQPETPEVPHEVAPAQPEQPSREETIQQLQENTASFWNHMNPFSPYWGGTSERTGIWRILIEHSIKAHPLVGTGYGTAIAVLQANGDEHSGAHNILIAILSDLGLIGLLLFGIPLVRLISHLQWRTNPAALLPLGMIVTALVTGVGEDIYTERFLWYAAGLALWLMNSPASSEFERLSDDESSVCDTVSVQ